MEVWKYMKNYNMPAPTNETVLFDASALEFPDWSGMQPHRPQMTFEQAVVWNDEMLSMFPLRKKTFKQEAERRCHAEFVL
jgi:hypothetical protein